MKSAVLFVVFNRPETTQQVFQAIREARPPRLYVAADGPRADREGEAERCAQARRVATDVDWPCEVSTLFRDRNLGCKLGVSSAISWFFANEEQGIILEDDVLPVPTFFTFCDELLERYRDDERVAMISGCNLISKRFRSDHSYFFSQYTHIWGWASWRRAWRHFDSAMPTWPEWRDRGGLTHISGGNRHFVSYWNRIFESTYRSEIDAWGYQWTFACWWLGAVSALPAVNLTRNIGFGLDATHTTGGAPAHVIESEPESMAFPLEHPPRVAREPDADRIIDRSVFGISLANTMKHKIIAIPGVRPAWSIFKRIVR